MLKRKDFSLLSGRTSVTGVDLKLSPLCGGLGRGGEGRGREEEDGRGEDEKGGRGRESRKQCM